MMDKREYDRIYHSNRSEEDKKRKLELQYKRINEIRGMVSGYKASSGCKICGINNPVVLEFDHRDSENKSFDISQGVSNGYGWERLLSEMDKCDVLCANCHRIKTSKDYWNSYKA